MTTSLVAPRKINPWGILRIGGWELMIGESWIFDSSVHVMTHSNVYTEEGF